MRIDFEKFGLAMAPAASRIEARRQALIVERAPVAVVPHGELPGNGEPESGEWASSKSSKPDTLPKIITLDELIANKELVIPPQIIAGFLHQGLKGVLGSGSKARKTWILSDMAISVSTGTPFWGMETSKGRVLYINFEIPDAFARSRYQALLKAKGMYSCPDLDIWNLRGHAAPLNVLEAEMIRRLKDRKYVLVIIDPIYKGLGGRDENAAGDVAEVCNELERIAVHTGAAVLFASHFSKGNQSSKEAIDRIAGSGVWARDADSMIVMTKHEEDDCYTIETVLRNLPEMDPFVVRWQYPLMTRDNDLDPTNLKQSNAGRKKEHDPMEVLAEIGDGNPIGISEWAAKSCVSRQNLYNYVREFRGRGWIETVGEGAKARQKITEKGRNLLPK